MSATVIPMPLRRLPSQLGPVPAFLTKTQVITTPSGPWLEVRLTVPLVNVPVAQRRPLARLLHTAEPVNLTLETAGGGEGG